MNNILTLGTCNSIGTLYNSLPNEERKEEVEAWARDRYPDTWKYLEEHVERHTTEDGDTIFKIPRDVRP